MENNEKVAATRRKFYSMRETAEVLNVAYITIFEYCKKGKIPSIMLGHKRLVPIAYIDNLVEQANIIQK